MKRIMMSKGEIRKMMLEKRKIMPEDVVKNAGNKIASVFLELFEEHERFLLYYAMNNEVETKLLIERLYREKKDVYLPKYVDGEFEGVKYEGSSKLKKGVFGVMEPESSEKCNDFDVIVVPGVAFATDGSRIGMGKGFYDRLLQKIKGVKVGFAYEFQVLEKIPTDCWDERMDMIITENKIYRRM